VSIRVRKADGYYNSIAIFLSFNTLVCLQDDIRAFMIRNGFPFVPEHCHPNCPIWEGRFFDPRLSTFLFGFQFFRKDLD